MVTAVPSTSTRVSAFTGVVVTVWADKTYRQRPAHDLVDVDVAEDKVLTSLWRVVSPLTKLIDTPRD